METTTLIAIFLMTFGIVSAALFATYIGDGLRWLSGRPRHTDIVLGNDMRGRKATVADVSSCGRAMTVRVGGEYWQAKALGNSSSKCAIGDEVHVSKMDGLTLKVKTKS